MPDEAKPIRRRATPRPAKSRSSDEPSAATRVSSDSTSTDANPLGLEGDEWTPPKGPEPAQILPETDFEPLPAEPLVWTPERAGSIVRAGGFLLHTADGVAREPGGDELWRATEADVDAIAPPLARILNRYEPTQRLAGMSDEAELAFGIIGYTRRNLAERGRLVTARRQADDGGDDRGVWPEGRPDIPTPPA